RSASSGARATRNRSSCAAVAGCAVKCASTAARSSGSSRSSAYPIKSSSVMAVTRLIPRSAFCAVAVPLLGQLRQGGVQPRLHCPDRDAQNFGHVLVLEPLEVRQDDDLS